MVRRNGQRNGRHENGGGHGFNLATIVQIGLIPLIAAGVTMFAQWVTNGDTLKRHENAITETIPKEFDQENKALADEASARQKNRDEFLDKLGQVKDGISTLNTTVQLQAQEQKHSNDTLEEISHKLDNVQTKPGR